MNKANSKYINLRELYRKIKIIIIIIIIITIIIIILTIFIQGAHFTKSDIQ